MVGSTIHLRTREHLGTDGPRVVGIDPSLTSTGVAWSDGCVGKFVPPNKVGKAEGRLMWLREQFQIHVLPRDKRSSTPRPDLVVLEGYSYASGNRAHQMGEWGGILRLMLHDSGIPYVIVPPKTRAMYATGKGNASKELVLVEAVKRLGYTGSDLDEVDALWLRVMGLHGIGHPVVELPQSHTRALDKIEWPAL